MRVRSGRRLSRLYPCGRLPHILTPQQPVEGGCTHAESEQIWLAAFKIEFENSEMERARGILAKARATLANERIWMKSALVERERGETEEVAPLHMLRYWRYTLSAEACHIVSVEACRLGSYW